MRYATPVESSASKRLSTNIKEKYKNVPWKDITGMREKLIHGYFGIDFNAVWDTVKKDIPELKKDITRIIKEFE